jgi:hypothetical protein
MRNLILLLIAFMAVVTFFRAFDKADAEALHDISQKAAVESIITN